SATNFKVKLGEGIFDYEPILLIYIHECSNDIGIELRAFMLRNFLPGVLQRRSTAIRTIGGHCIERIDNRKNSRTNGNFIALQTPRISASIKFLLMREHDLGNISQYPDIFQDSKSDSGMAAHVDPLFAC